MVATSGQSNKMSLHCRICTTVLLTKSRKTEAVRSWDSMLHVPQVTGNLGLRAIVVTVTTQCVGGVCSLIVLFCHGME